MTSPTIGTLRVDGASLHYETRGEGPLLLLISGGAGDAASYDGVIDRLATEYTVVAYDARGMSRSPLDDPNAEQSVAEHADDAFRLIELLSPDAPAKVFGASSGAIAALQLLTAHPERVERVVAHEPPLIEVLPDAAVHRALIERVQTIFHSQGLMPAMTEFAAGLRKDGDTTPPPAQTTLPPQAAARAERTMANLPYFVSSIVPSFMTHDPNVAQLKPLSDQIVLLAGEDSPGELPYRATESLATQIGVPLHHVPGNHIGLTTHPTPFTKALLSALRPN